MATNEEQNQNFVLIFATIIKMYDAFDIQFYLSK